MDEDNNVTFDIESIDFTAKKDKFADLIEEYIQDSDKEKALVDFIEALKTDYDFRDKALFQTFFDELQKNLPELSRMELKQRVSMIRTFEE